MHVEHVRLEPEPAKASRGAWPGIFTLHVAPKRLEKMSLHSGMVVVGKLFAFLLIVV